MNLNSKVYISSFPLKSQYTAKQGKIYLKTIRIYKRCAEQMSCWQRKYQVLVPVALFTIFTLITTMF